MRPLKSVLRPKVVKFGSEDLKLMLGPHVLGSFDPDRGWKIRPPFRLFIDEKTLPDRVNLDSR